MKIGQKFYMGFLGIVFLSGIMGYFGFNAINQTNGEFDRVEKRTIPVLQIIKDLKLASLYISAGTERENPSGGKLANEGYVFYDQSVNKYKALAIASLEERKALFDLVNAGQRLKNTSFEIFELRKNNAADDDIAIKEKEFAVDKSKFLSTINDIEKTHQEEFLARKDVLSSLMFKSKNIIAGVGILGVIIAGAFCVVMVRLIVNPIRTLTETTDNIRGDIFDVRFDIPPGDEMGNLFSSFNMMMSKLKKSVEALKSSNGSLKEANAALEQKVREKTKALEKEKDCLEKKVEDRTRELEQNVEKLKKYNKAMVGRELRIIALKKEVKELKNLKEDQILWNRKI